MPAPTRWMMMRHVDNRIPLLVSLGACLLGTVSCAEPPGSRRGGGLGGIDGDDTGIGTGFDDGASPHLDGDDGSDSADDGGDGGNKFDVGSDDSASNVDDGDSEDDSCRSVDFLFVIDSSISMASNQADLVAAFPDFVDTMTATLDSVDSFHVGVVTSGAYAGNDPSCLQIGSLVTQTAGPDSSSAKCGPFAEGRYMTEADDLATAFECAARVGTGGDNDEKVMKAAVTAISPELGAPGACNEGFIRPDALLVLVLITDEDDPGSCGIPLVGCAGSPGDPTAWYDEVLDQKVHPENVVVLSLTRGAPGNACGAAGLAEIDAERIMTFAGMFGDNGFTGDICSPFGPTLQQAVSVIDSACDAYVPVG